jgi:exopolysaccharide biosynthesis polyprenyl glycosylphosphotransferase
MKSNNKIKLFFLVLGDFIFLFGALFFALFLRYTPLDTEAWKLIKLHLIPFGIIFLGWLMAFGAFGIYDLRMMKNNKLFFYRLINAVGLGTLIAILILYLVPSFEIEPRRNLFLIAFSALIILSGWRFLFNYLIIKTPSWKVLFLGTNKEVAELTVYLLNHPQLGQKPVGWMSINNNKPELMSFTGELTSNILYDFNDKKRIEQIIKEFSIDTVVITQEIKENKTLIDILFNTIPLGIGVVEFTKFYEMFTGKVPLSLIEKIWFLENLVGLKKNAYELFKRFLDITVALLASIPAIFLFPFIALAIKLDSEGPIFYKQKRVGRHGREFLVIKYRTMVKNAEQMSGLKGVFPDPRHTRVGRFMRKSYLDELPQIINILKGEMSFVGPRPERPEYVAKLKQKIPFYEMRLLVLPGITGWAQINMENDASVEDAPEKMQYDLYYIKNRSFILDLLIILRTIFIVLRRQGR